MYPCSRHYEPNSMVNNFYNLKKPISAPETSESSGVMEQEDKVKIIIIYSLKNAMYS